MPCEVKTHDIPVTCQSGNLTLHPPKSREEGNRNRLVKVVHWVRREVNGKYDTRVSEIAPYCADCCPLCSRSHNRSVTEAK